MIVLGNTEILFLHCPQIFLNGIVYLLKRALVCAQDGTPSNQADLCWQKFRTRFSEVVRSVIHFSKRIPGFLQLSIEDQLCLVKGGAFEVGD